MTRYPFLLFLLSSVHALSAVGSLVSNAEELEAAVAAARPGDVITLRAGEWLGLDVSLEVAGSASAPIVLKAEEPGKTIFRGPTRLRLQGQYGHLSGLRFEGAFAAGGASALVQIGERDSGSRQFRLSHCAFVACNPAEVETRYAWISIYGKEHRIDHNLFAGQTHSGVTVQVRVDEANPEHRIDHNLFRDRVEGNGNGFEMIQIGQSGDSMKRGGCQVERNWFVRCDGETEIISSKTNENAIRNNLFYDCAGTVTLRHGKRSVVADNYFYGAGKTRSGGVRVIDSDHRVEHNHFQDLTGRTGGVVVLYCGIPGSPLNGYFPASEALVAHNRFEANTGVGVYLNGGFGRNGRTLLPQEVELANNVWRSQASGVVAIGGTLRDVSYQENQYVSGIETGVVAPEGMSLEETDDLNDAAGPRRPFPGRVEVGPSWHLPLPDLMLVEPARLVTLARADEGPARDLREDLLFRAEAVLAAGKTYAVNANAKIPPSGNPHDYYSTGPYWWPDPQSPDGLPYIRRDGEFNPERDLVSDREPLLSMIDDVELMAWAYAVSGEEKYAHFGHRLLATWFLDEATAMTPHLRHAQAIPGRSDGRKTGIIDTHPFAELVDAMVILESSPLFPREDALALHDWFGDFLEWLLASPNGRGEQAAQNNHGTAFDLQAAALMWYVGAHDRLRDYFESTVLPRVEMQIMADGAQPLELERTRSWSYVTENLEHFFKLGLIGRRVGVDLFGYVAPSGASLRKALEFALPAACDHSLWSYEQATAWSESYLNGVLSIASGVYADPKFEETRECLRNASNTLEAYLLRPLADE